MRPASHPSARSVAAPLLLLLLAFPGAQVVTVLRDAVQAARPLRQMGLPAPDAVADRSYQTIAAALPQTGRIGFIRTSGSDTPAFAQDLVFLQYSLTPRQIVAGWDADVILVRGDTAPVAGVLRERSLSMTHDLGGEWRVFRRAPR
jgi:hypothetical protein